MFENVETLQRISIFAVVFGAAMLFFFLWNRREERRFRAMRTAEILESWGFTLLAKLFRAYAVGNYVGGNSVIRTMREIIDEIQGGGLPNMLRTIGWKVVEGVFLKNDDDRTKLAELLAVPKPAVDPTPPPPTLTA